MNDLDPQVLRLREVEARIAFAERMLREQQTVVRRLASQGHLARLAHELEAHLRESLATLARRRQGILDGISASGSPMPPSALLHH